MTSESDARLEALSAPFQVGEVKQRSQGGRKLDYISIDSTIRRFNEVCGLDWSTHGLEVSVTPAGTEDKNGAPQWLAVVSLSLSAIGKVAAGTGADIASDPDKAVKTALAEALKKAGHQFGVGLYLWLEEEREVVARQRAEAATSLQDLQLKVKAKYLKAGPTADDSAASIAAFFNVSVDDLKDADMLRRILEG